MSRLTDPSDCPLGDARGDCIAPAIRPMVLACPAAAEGPDMTSRLHSDRTDPAATRRSGDARSGDARAGDARAGDARAGDRRTPGGMPGWRPLVAAIAVVAALALLLHLLYR